jgi:hypothetical protein
MIISLHVCVMLNNICITYSHVMRCRYDELKQTGKLQSFLNKKRKRNSNKDHRKIPMARQEE